MSSSRAVIRKRVNSSCWSNSEVLRWLIDEDQEQFISAFLLNNVLTGALLKQMLDHDTDALQMGDLHRFTWDPVFHPVTFCCGSLVGPG